MRALLAFIRKESFLRRDELASAFEEIDRTLRCHHVHRTTAVGSSYAKLINDRLFQALPSVNFSGVHHHLHNIVHVCILHGQIHTLDQTATQAK